METATADGAQVVRRLQDFARQRTTSPLMPCDLAGIAREVTEGKRNEGMDAARRRSLLLGSEGMGRGDDPLGATILRNFLQTLVANPLRTETIVCWNAGVKLLTATSPALETVQQLEGIGVEILACKTCVEHFDLSGKLKAGQVSTMPVISDLLLRGDVLTV